MKYKQIFVLLAHHLSCEFGGCFSSTGGTFGAAKESVKWFSVGQNWQRTQIGAPWDSKTFQS